MSDFLETNLGQLPGSWRLSKVIYEAVAVTDFVANGSFASLKENVTYKSKIDFAILIRMVDFSRGFEGDFVYVDEHSYNFLKKSKLFGGEIIISNVGEYAGTVFRVPKLDRPMTLGPNSIMVNFGQSNDFYYYWFKSPLGQDILRSIRTGSAIPKFNKTDFRNLDLPVPPIIDQESIAKVLSSFDNKIDLLHRQNKTLEQMAETLFRQWFVEEENKQIILKDVIKTTSGGTPSRANSTYYNGTIPWVKSKELNNNFILTTEEHITEEGLNKSSAKLLKPFTVMIAMYGATVGEIGIIEKSATCNQAICAIEQTEEYPYTFLDQFFKSIKTDLVNLAVGGAQQNISQDLIKTLELPAPSAKIIKYNEIVSPFYNKVLENVKQIQKLTELSDLLLPNLMNGSIKVFNN